MANEQPFQSSYLDHLPAIFHQDDEQQEASFLGSFLRAFEAILGPEVLAFNVGLGLEKNLGADLVPESLRKAFQDNGKPLPRDNVSVSVLAPGCAWQIRAGRQLYVMRKKANALNISEIPILEQTIAGIHTYFDPQQAPGKFLPWLAGWVALSLRDDWTEKQKRDFLSDVVPLYQKRGTAIGLKKLLSIYTELGENSVTITEFPKLPFYFQVDVRIRPKEKLTAKVIEQLQEKRRREQRIVRDIIDQHKPAHTYYAARVELMATMQIGVVSTIGEDTLLGSVPPR